MESVDVFFVLFFFLCFSGLYLWNLPVCIFIFVVVTSLLIIVAVLIDDIVDDCL